MANKNQIPVYHEYDAIADWFDQTRDKSRMELTYLNFIVQTLPKSGTILDLGCGTGEPIARFFIEKGFKLTGVDGSPKMIEFCKQRFPTEEWIISDMREINLRQRFDAILAWHSFFHLDQDSQRKMFNIFESHIKPGGILMFTSGEAEGEVWSENGGRSIYHASLSTEEYSNLLKRASFEVLIHKIRDPECGEATVWVAKKLSR